MQHPVGYVYNPVTKQDELGSFAAVLFNPAQLAGFPHVIAGAFLTAGALIAAVAGWHLLKATGGLPGQHTVERHASAFRSALHAGVVTTVVSMAFMFVTGDIQGKLFTTRYQPMKMAAAEALYHTTTPAPFSLFTIGTLNGSKPVFSLDLPRLLSFLGTGNWSGTVQGIDNLQAQDVAKYGPGSYIPIIPVTYWSFRLMIGFGMLAAVIAVVAWWVTRTRGGWVALGKPGAALKASLTQGKLRRLLLVAVIAMPFMPLLGNATGWIMTEVGRQPWLVYGQLKTADGVSPTSGGEVLTSLIVYALLYGVLAVIEFGLMFTYIKRGLAVEPEPDVKPSSEPLELVY
jgi:cytochrome d ubiquinol oxidase subunit I